MPTPLTSYSQIKVGDIYEDCAFHPCLCVKVDSEDDELLGISLIDGSYPRGCSIGHCGVQLLTLEEALEWKRYGPPQSDLPEEKQWWNRPNQFGFGHVQ